MGPTAGAERHYTFHFWSTHARLSKNVPLLPKNPLFFFPKSLRYVPLLFKLNQLDQTAR
jgi:hypothetical protein